MDTLRSWFQENERSGLANGSASEEKACWKGIRGSEPTSTETGQRANLLRNYSPFSPGQDTAFSSQDVHYNTVTGTAESCAKVTSGERQRQLTVFGESPMSPHASLVSRPDQHTNLPPDKSQTRPHPNHNMPSGSQDAHFQRLPFSATQRHLSESFSQASQPNPFLHIKRGLSQEEPDCFTQLSELETTIVQTSNANCQRQSKRRRFVPRRFGDSNYAMRETEHESAVNLDLSCPLWSQQSPLSSQAPSQAFQTKFSTTSNFTKNPQCGKNLSPWSAQAFLSTENLDKNSQSGKKLSPPLPSKAFQAKFARANLKANLKKNPCTSGKKLSTVKPAAAKTANAASQTAAGKSNQKEIRAPNKVLITTPKQSSSSLNIFQGPPRFSELLTQTPQPKSSLPPKTTRPSIVEPCPRFTSQMLSDPAKSSETGITGQDDTGGVALGFKENLRKQILACLLEPDFEELVAEVEKIWEDLQESVSDSLESQVLGSLLEKGPGFLLSQSRRS